MCVPTGQAEGGFRLRTLLPSKGISNWPFSLLLSPFLSCPFHSAGSSRTTYVPRASELVATAGRSLDYALLALPPPPTRASSVSLSLPLTSLSLPSLFLSVPSRASLLLPLQIPRFGVSVPLLERFPLPLGRLPFSSFSSSRSTISFSLHINEFAPVPSSRCLVFVAPRYTPE